MDFLLVISQQLICCISLLFMESVPVSNAFPFLSTNITNPLSGNAHTGPSEQLTTHTSFHTSETANFHIQPTKVKQMTQTNLNLIAAITEATMNSKSDVTRLHHRHQHKHRHLSHSLKESNEHHWHHSTRFLIESTPTQVQTMQTKAPHFGDTNSIITSSPTFTTEELPDFPKLSMSSSMHTSAGTTARRLTPMSTKDFKITETATSIGIKASIFPVVHPITDFESSTLQQTSTTTTTTTTTPGPALPGTSDQTTTQDITTPKNVILQTSNSTEKHFNLEPTFKTMINQFANLTVQSTDLDTNNQTVQNESLFNQDRKAFLNELMVNKTITSVYIQPTPILLMPHLNTKYRPSHFNNPSKDSTQRPARNILSLNMRGQSQWKNSKDLMPSRSGLLHLTENDPPTSYAYKPQITHKKDFTSLPRDGNAKVLAAVTTEFMKSSEVIPDLFVTPTKTQKSHSTKGHYEGHGGTGPSSVTAALSFKSKDEHLILSATATLNPSRMTYTCTIPCTQPGCMCCQDQQLAQGTATTAVTRRPPSNTTPNIQVSTDKSPAAEQISLSAGFGIGMGCLIAIWLVVGPVVCLICRIRDQVKGGEGNLDEMEKRKKQHKEKAAKKEHPLTEAIVMDELNKQFTKKKNSRENEYLLLAKDKAELECLSRTELSKTITKKPMSTFDRTRSPHCLNKWDESDIEDDSDEDDDDEKDRFTPVSNTPTVSV